jgi:tripartite motif-containing protein 71
MPIGVASGTRDEIFVADRQNHRVQKLSSEGKFLFGYGGHGNRLGSLSHPEAVAVAGERLFVADTGNHRIQVFHQKTGRPLGTIGGRGTSLPLRDPQGIAVDEARGRLFVSDSGNNRLLCFHLHSPHVQLLSEFGENGEVPLISPTCVAVDTDGFVLVTSSKEHLLTILSPQGAKVKELGGEERLFKTPYGICVNVSGNVVVADSSMPGIHVL